MTKRPPGFTLGPTLVWNGTQCIVAGLGVIQVYNEKGSACCDINGYRVFSAHRYGITGAMHSISDDVRRWAYINQYAKLRSV